MDHLAGLTEEARKLALERFRKIQPHIEDSQPLRSVARAAGIPYRTAQRWGAVYRRSGLTALARNKRGDRGERCAVSKEAEKAIEGLALAEAAAAYCGSVPSSAAHFSGASRGGPQLWHRAQYRPWLGCRSRDACA